ncbi:DUF4260 domain-containing protein [Algoriphagus sp. NG3]|uniref:DUF4260 domain-containing protein n=1 Tax=unclassified Algoriphagus TaxID=2641541 RepID=UPI002A83770A|nr:DUF4260 domain-containing protein [Algoriphagus sp. NG3]WPR76247.1 DUF4260 domain-containing protein [Algoriphagus sp. NG3]
MEILIQIEELTMFLGSIHLFSRLNLKWWWFPALVMLPDLGMLGYLVNDTLGAVTYNIVHFRGAAVIFGLYGLAKGNRKLMLIGIILFAHATMDRAIGTGLKYFDGFWHTSLSTHSFL